MISEEGYLSNGLALTQDQLLDEDNGGHLVPFRSRPQLAKGKPIPILFFLEGLCKEVLNSNKIGIGFPFANWGLLLNGTK